MYASQWFITLFAVNFPFDVLVRIWDIYLLEGEKTIYRVAIAMLLKNESRLLVKDFEELMKKLKDMYKIEDVSIFIKEASSIKITNSVLQVYFFCFY